MGRGVAGFGGSCFTSRPRRAQSLLTMWTASFSITCGPRRVATKTPGPHGAFLPQHPGAAPCPSPLRWHLLRGAQCLCPVPLSPFLLETPRSIPRDGCWCSWDAPGSLPSISAPSVKQRGPGSPPLWGCLGTPSPWSCALLQQESPGAGGGRLHEAGWRDVGVCGVKDGVIWHGLHQGRGSSFAKMCPGLILPRVRREEEAAPAEPVLPVWVTNNPVGLEGTRRGKVALGNPQHPSPFPIKSTWKQGHEFCHHPTAQELHKAALGVHLPLPVATRPSRPSFHP